VAVLRGGDLLAHVGFLFGDDFAEIAVYELARADPVWRAEAWSVLVP
jgi:hypothetical protein